MSGFCSCCKVMFKDSDDIFSIPCCHIFHQACLLNSTDSTSSTFVSSNEKKSNNCPICFNRFTAYDTERLYIYSSTASKKESSIFDNGLQITKKKMQIQRTINRNKNTSKLGELIALMEEVKATEKKMNDIKMRNLRIVQGGGSTGDDAGSPSVVAKIKLKRDLQLQHFNDEVEILDVKICNMPHKLRYSDAKMDF